VMVPLEQDAEFFSSLHSQIHDADAFCDRTKAKFVDRVDSLARTLTIAASPKDKDMYVWREIIRTFLETDIWMEDTSEGRRERSAPEALRAFHQLRHHLLQIGTVQSLRLAASRDAYIHFVQMVEELVTVKRFQELNAVAMRKILKKHDKRTHLQAQITFPNLLLADSFSVQDVARTIAATISDRIIPIVPQLDDYLCPVCYSLFWKPVRLSCSHVFCVRCLVKAQRRELNDCPVCREPMAVVQAHADNMDASLLNLLELYFPKELKEKRKESERE
ncbi:SPX domain-containing protein, partial [Piptocephalis cylindrospora]